MIKTILILSMFIMVVSLNFQAEVQNPLVTNIYKSDTAAYQYNDSRLYLYADYDPCIENSADKYLQSVTLNFGSVNHIRSRMKIKLVNIGIGNKTFSFGPEYHLLKLVKLELKVFNLFFQVPFRFFGLLCLFFGLLDGNLQDQVLIMQL